TKKMYPVLLIAFGLFLLATYAFVPYVFSNLESMYYLILISLILLGLSILFKVRESRFAKFMILLWIFASINFFGLIEYPYMFGKGVDVTQYMTGSAIAGPASIITIVGGILVGLALLYLAVLNSNKKKD
ncbi:MAG: hypothetical protein ABSA33_06335, partial [Candidatus Micrarchaeaceae archaeon]